MLGYFESFVSQYIHELLLRFSEEIEHSKIKHVILLVIYSPKSRRQWVKAGEAMNSKMITLLLLANLGGSLQAVKIINKSGGACYLSNFKQVAQDGQRISVPIEEHLLNNGEEREYDNIKSFYVRQKLIDPPSNIRELDNSMIVTIVYRRWLDTDKELWFNQPVEVSSKENNIEN
jgi:hypothetical protein